MIGTLVVFNPMLPWPWLIAAGSAALLLGWLGLRNRARGGWLRLMLAALFLLVLANPSALREERRGLSDVAAVIIDDSASQKLGTRALQTAAALEMVQLQLAGEEDLDVRVTRVPGLTETGLITGLQQTLADVPERRSAGAVLITDGEIHDVPANPAGLGRYGPIQVLLTGKPGEFDRRLTLVTTPAFGIVGKSVTARVRIDDRPGARGEAATVTLRYDIDKTASVTVKPGTEADIELPVSHPGANIFELVTDALPDEVTESNNRVALSVQGVRERLRVLLVSGTPHPGERAWRNLLKSDPAVELVHFTILRPPEKQDGTPMNEMSLIAFPVKELFETKLKQFDLIIFDRMRRQGVLPEPYLKNIADYIEAGGALLDIGGAAYAGSDSLYDTALGRALPTKPTGRVIDGELMPALTETGRRHPITAGLGTAGLADNAAGGSAGEDWGPWLQQVEVKLLRGVTLMTGAEGKPLFVLDHFGQGRVGQLLSDEIWLWSRNFRGGGPQAELLRRLAHWLMREPELEEEALSAHAHPVEGGYAITVERQSLDERVPPVTLTAPDGGEQLLELVPGQRPGRFTATQKVTEEGVWRLHDDSHATAVPVGPMDAREWQDVRATAEILQPVAAATGGGVFWLDAQARGIEVRRVAPQTRAWGTSWLGLRRNGDYVVTGAKAWPLLPALAIMVLLLGFNLATWWREGR